MVNMCQEDEGPRYNQATQVARDHPGFKTEEYQWPQIDSCPREIKRKYSEKFMEVNVFVLRRKNALVRLLNYWSFRFFSLRKETICDGLNYN